MSDVAAKRATPEQVLGNLFQFVMTMRQKGVRITRRTQALGSAAVDTLRREGWVIVRHDAEDKAYKAGWQAAMEDHRTKRDGDPRAMASGLT